MQPKLRVLLGASVLVSQSVAEVNKKPVVTLLGDTKMSKPTIENNPELGSAMVADADLPKVLRLEKLFNLNYCVVERKPFVQVTVVGRK